MINLKGFTYDIIITLYIIGLYKIYNRIIARKKIIR